MMQLEEEDSNLSVSVIWRGEKFVVEISSAASLNDLGQELQKLTGVSEDTMRLLMPKSSTAGSKLLYPFAGEHSHLSLQEVSLQEGKPIRMMGATKDEVVDIIKNEKANLRIAGFEEEDRRLRQRMLARPQNTLKLPQGTYIFCEFRTLDLPGIKLNPPPSEALKRMHRLAADPGIVAIMNKHRWRVGIMSEMAPEGFVGISSVCILGLNKNHGEEISLRLRTDDLKGFRKYEIIKKTLLHELAHMVYSEHDANFHAINSQLNKEASSLDWTRSTSHKLSGSAPSANYEEEFEVEDYGNNSQKLGGDTSGLLMSARSSSVAAAYNRLATVSVSEVSREEKDTDASPFTIHKEHSLNAEIISFPQRTRGYNSDLDCSCNKIQSEIEPEPDHIAIEETMESEPYGDPWEGVHMSKIVDELADMEVLTRAKTSEEPDPDDANPQPNSIGGLEDGLNGCRLTNQQRNGHTESEPEPNDCLINGATPDAHHPKNTRGSMDEPNLDDLGIVSLNYHPAVSDEVTIDQEKSTYEEPDPDSFSEALAEDKHTEVNSNYSVPMDIYEPDPDDEVMKRIQDPVMIFCSRLQKAIDSLRSQVKPGDFDTVRKTITKIISNVIEHPNEMKFKRLRKANPALTRNIANYKAAMEILSLIGFQEDIVPNDIGSFESYMVFRELWKGYALKDGVLVPNTSHGVCEVAKEPASDQIADDKHFNVTRGPLKSTTPAPVNYEEPAAKQLTADEEHVRAADQEQVNGPREHLKCSSPATWSAENTKIDPPLSFSMQVRASEEHMIDKDELGGRLEARDELKEPTMERPIATSQEAPTGKCKDPGAFTVTCGIGETLIHHCLIDLGAAVYAMPYSLYCSLKLGPLKPPKLLIELGDKSCVHPVGLLENLTLCVGDLVVPADFYVLQLGDDRDEDPPTLILRRPFLFAMKTKIDMDTGLLSLAFGGRTSNFYIYEDDDRPCTKKPLDIVNTSYLAALLPDPPGETSCATRSAAMIKVSSQTREDVKANPPDRWGADTSTSLHDDFGQIEGIAEAKFDLTRPWNPNL
ncbi:unnamed protein product [Rhodiola kirilowii]